MAERQNTNNQLPSNDLADLNDNTIIIDEFVNSKKDFTIDRFGQQFKTRHKILTDLIKLTEEIGEGALPATMINENGEIFFAVNNHVNFKNEVIVNDKSVIAELTNIDNEIELIKTKIGDFRLMPFRANELPYGWYFRNGDNYLLSSAQGQVLNRLSNNYKRDHQITIKNINGQQYINVPSAFAPDGRGFFERAVNGTTRHVGTIEGDAIRNITGNFDNVLTSISDSTTGAFYRRSTHNKYNISKIGDGNGGELVSGDNFDASRVVPTAHENRPVNIGMTPAIYLGV